MNYSLFHYFDTEIGPFKNLSKLTLEHAEELSKQLKQDDMKFASQRSSDYIIIRRELEQLARSQFIMKGGRPKNPFPHYLTLGTCEWLKTWYRNPGVLEIPWDEFLEESISFTYGDLFPTMRFQDNKPYRKQDYTKQEIIEIIKKYGFPQDWNSSGNKGPERYIEVQIWD